MDVRRRRAVPTAPPPARAGGRADERPAGPGSGRHTLLLAVLLAAATLAGPAGLAGQAPSPFDVLQLQREYEAARSSCDAAVLARDVEMPAYDAVVAQARRADRSGDDDLWQSAQRRLFEMSQVIEAMKDRIEERCGIADETRTAYLDGLDRRRRSLEAELARNPTDARRRDVQVLLDDIANRYAELEEEGQGLQLRVVMRPLIEIDPRDTPDAVRAKAAYLEREALQYDTLLLSLDQEIERLEARVRRQRGQENFRANLGRFDDTRTPVGADPREGTADPAVAADSTSLSGGSLEARLQATLSVRQQLEHYRDQMRAKASEFRDYLRAIT